MEKKLRYMLVIIVAFLSFVYFSDKIYAISSYTIEDYSIDFVIKDDGNVKVTEKIEYSFKERVLNINKDILLSLNGSSLMNEEFVNDLKKSEIQNLKIFMSDDGINYVEIHEILDSKNEKKELYLKSIQDDICNIELYLHANSNTKKYIMYEYELKNLAVKYKNACVVGINFIAKNLKTDVNKIDVRIKLEDEVQDIEIFRVYPHSYCKVSEIQYEGNVANFKIYNLGLQSAVDAKIVLKGNLPSKLDFSVLKDYDLKQMMESENKIDKKKDRYIISKTIYYLCDIYMVISYISLIIIIINKKNNGKEKDIKAENVILNKHRLLEYNNLCGKSCLETTAFGATLIELEKLGYISMETIKNNIEVKNVKDSFEFFISLKASTDFSKLDRYQILVINYLFNGIVKSDKIENLEHRKIFLKETLKEISKNYKLVKEFAKECSLIDEELKKKMYNKNSNKNIKIYIIISTFIVTCITLINTFIVSPLTLENNIVAVTLSGFFLLGYIILLLPFMNIEVIKKEYIDDYNEMQKLKKYITNYPIVDQKIDFSDINQLLDLLEFACIFNLLQGFSKKIIKDLAKENEFNESVRIDDNSLFEVLAKYKYLIFGYSFSNISTVISTATGSNSGGGYSG